MRTHIWQPVTDNPDHHGPRSGHIMDTPTKSPRWIRFRSVAIGLATFLVLFGIFGYFAGPPIARSLLTDVLTKRLHRPVTLGEININPYAMTVRIADLRIGDTAGGEAAGFDELFVDLDITSIFRAAPVIEEFRLVGPRVHLVHEAPGKYNISDLLDEWLKPGDSPAPMPRFSVNNIRIIGGRIDFEDRPVSSQHAVTDINLALPFISNLAHQANIFTEPAFSANINGAPLELAGQTKPFGEVKESEFKLELDHFDLTRYLVYSPVSLPFTVTGALLDTDLALSFRNDGKNPAALAISGRVGIHDVNLVESGERPLLKLGKLEIPVTGVEPLNAVYRFGGIRLEGLETFVRVDRDGNLNWLAMAARLRGEDGQSATNAKKAPVTWSVDGLQVSQSAIHWQDDSLPQSIVAHITGIDVTVGKANDRLADLIPVDVAWSVDAAPHAAADRIEIKDARIDLARNRVDVAGFAAHGIRLVMVRQADGGLAGLRLPVLKSDAAGKSDGQTKVSAGGTPWIIALGKAELADARLRFEDKSVGPATTQVVELAKLTLEEFSTETKAPPAKLSVAARVNGKGELQAGGTVQVVPLAARLKLDLRGLELLPLQPYFGEKLNLTITKGQVATKGDLELIKAAEGGFGGGYRGQISVGNFHSVDKVNSADFLTWKSFHMDKLDLKTQPFALAIGQVALTDFYANLYVSPEGKLNLMQIVRKEERTETNAGNTEQPSPAPSPDKPAVPIAEGAPAKAEKAPQPPIRIDQVTLQGGTVNIDDEFIKPNYSAHLTEIGGRITGLSSEAGSTADLDLRGSYDGAPVAIAGKLNPLAALPSLDIKAEVRGVEMTPLSPYAGKYAGYAIDKGKLSLFLTYKIANNKLQADNRVFLDQLTFGEKVESADAIKLPVTLAVALLKNRRGEIDINLPIAGSLDDPQFSVGGIIVQVIVNLVTKAITAPFALLGSLFGGGEELSYADFSTGRASLTEATAKKLESLAKALDDRPELKLEITGRVDPEKDREGLRQAALEHKVKAQKLAQLVKAGKEAGSVDDVAVDDKEYLPLLEQAYKQEKFPKPRNVIGLTKSLPREEMEKLMFANAPASDDDLRELAKQRAKSVADWLAGTGKIPRERIFLLPPKLAVDDSGPKEAPLSRADFSLK